MKKLLLVTLAMIWFLWFSSAAMQTDEAIYRMNQNGLTKFSDAKNFMADNSLRRDEASKFFVQYAKEIMKITPDTSKTTCNFNDLDEAWPDLKDLIKESCQLWLFQWSNGNFMPTQQLTNAQAITVLIRMIDWKKDETKGHFASLYFEKAQGLWIMNWLTLNSTINFDKLTTRGDVWILLYNASKLISEKSTIIETNNNVIVQNYCASERPNDVKMIDYCEDKQYDAIKTLKLGKPSDITSNQFSLIRNKCTTEWPTDFSMRAYCEDKQYDAIRTLNLGKPSDIWDKEHAIILIKCESEWPTDFNMKSYCQTQQYNAIRKLNILKTTASKRTSCSNERPTDYTMRVYCEQN